MEDNILKSRKLKENPFSVPDGYFDKVRQDVMGKLPECEHINMSRVEPRRRLLRPIVAAAASICVAVFGVTAYLHYFNNSEQPDVSDTQVLFSSSSEPADYILMDNADIYNYMSDL
jgi:hypothetical protein